MKTSKLIAVEHLEGSHKEAFARLMELIPESQQTDQNLQRLIAFRLKLDGEDPTRDFIIRKLELAADCDYSGSFFAFLRDDQQENACNGEDE